MNATLTWASLGLAGAAWAGLEPLPGHWDITPTYDTSNQLWTWMIEDGPVEKSPATVFFPGYDGDFFAGEGERFDRPPGEEWDFLGVPEEEPVWIFPESTTYDDQVEPGMGDTQFGIFSENLQVSLVAVDGPPGASFSLFDSSGTVFMSSSDGIDASDLLLKPDFHSHFNWAFSQLGMWRVRLQVMGYLGPGQANPTPTSAEVPLHFAIGGVARWRASQFDSTVVMQDAVAGPGADPDADQLPNLVEFALGGDPNDANASIHGGSVAPEAGLDGGRLTLSFHQKIEPADDEGILIEVLWADSPAGPWTPGGVETAAVPIESTGWKRLTLRDAAPAPADTRFARVRVTELP